MYKIAGWLLYPGLNFFTFALKSLLPHTVLCISVKLLVARGPQVSLNCKIKIPIWVPAKLQSVKTSSAELEGLIHHTMKSRTKRGIRILHSRFCAVSAPGGLCRVLFKQTVPKLRNLNGQGQQKCYCHCHFTELRHKGFQWVAEHPMRYLHQTQELSTDLLPLVAKAFIKAFLTAILKQTYCVLIHHKNAH